MKGSAIKRHYGTDIKEMENFQVFEVCSPRCHFFFLSCKTNILIATYSIMMEVDFIILMKVVYPVLILSICINSFLILS
jgi:hypothetical protein